MPLRKLGDKLKSSLHHLSPKNKKTDEACCGDLSPSSLPPAKTAQQQPLCPCPAETKACCKEKEGEKLAAKEEPTRTDTPAPTATTAEVVCDPLPACPQGCDCPRSAQATTPRFAKTADIFPTMYYLLKTHDEEPVQQSVLLVNPSKSDKNFSLRLTGDSGAELEKDAVSISGNYVERVTVTIKPEKETSKDVYIDLLDNEHLYDKMRVRVQPY